MTIPYQVRRYQPEDFQAVAELAVAASSSPSTACGQPDVASTNEFEADYGHRNLEQEGWVAEGEGGTILGFAAGNLRNQTLTIDGPIVLAEARHQGIGTALFARIEQDAHATGALALEGGVRASNATGQVFLRKHGYKPSREIYCYEAHSQLESPVVAPESYRLGELKPKYLLPFLMVMHECFPGYRLPSNPQRLFEPDKMKIFLALDDQDKVAGAVTAFFYPEDHMGYIYHLGVSEPHRRRGLSRALLQGACDWLWTSHTPRFIGLSTSDEAGVRHSLYERVGFKLQYALVYLKKPVPQPAKTRGE
ncbi:MAG: family acetyltransferase [Cyanobacteria bacterium RYN_339]|nr:family acetyltransferase [Cyanobacteria bacterium RYN_339]